MKCEFSETQFAFCYTFEILKSYADRLQIPWFPTLRQEGRADGGFDTNIKYKDPQIDGSLFLQFKRPEYLKRKKIFKFKIDTSSNQHKALIALKENKPSNLVFYCAPKFYSIDDCNAFFIKKQIEEKSALFRINDFPDSDGIHKLEYEFFNSDESNITNRQLLTEKPISYGKLYSQEKHIPLYSKISWDYKPDPMLLSVKAEFLYDAVLRKFDHTLPSKVQDGAIIETVFSIFMSKYNIIWFPITKYL